MSNWKGYKIIINKFGNWQLAIWQNWSFGQLYHSRILVVENLRGLKGTLNQQKQAYFPKLKTQ